MHRFGSSFRRLLENYRLSLQRIKRYDVPLVGSAKRFANLGVEIFLNVNNRTQTLCQILRMITIQINFIPGAQHFTFHPAGNAFGF